MNSNNPLFLGIDVGTGGARAMILTETGEVAANASVPFDPDVLVARPGQHEQPPQAWWRTVCQAVREALAELDRNGSSANRIAALAVDGTSGTVVALSRAGDPLRPALMYNDPRSADEADALNDAAGEFCQSLGYRFNASFALAKIAWLRTHEPAVFDQAARFVHQADYIVEQLTGEPAATDYSNALKTGYDLHDEKWPAWIDEHLGIIPRLPRVVPPGTPIGAVSHKAAAETGLPPGIAVVAGATDGTAAFLASGARRIGDYNTTLGTTLVFKGISSTICRHPQGVIYCHKLPGGWWLPGAASNVGADWIAAMFPGVDVRAMDAAAAQRLPFDGVAYPLIRVGERFPFLAPDAHGFLGDCPICRVGENRTVSFDPDLYAACLQGIALVERLAYGVLDAAAGTRGTEEVVAKEPWNREGALPTTSSVPLRPAADVYSTGGGSRSDVWMQCRADVTGRLIHRPENGESAFGTAVLAAAGTRYNSIVEAVERMVRVQRSFAPNPRLAPVYNALFERFHGELRKRGYL